MKKAVVLIDIQNDFLDGGALPVPFGDEVIPIANKLISMKPAKFDYAVASQDWHPKNHKSFASQHPGRVVGEQIQLGGLKQTLWPDHCVQDSVGSKFSLSLKVDGFDAVFRKGVNLYRDSYSAFFDNFERKQEKYPIGTQAGTGLHEWLTARSVGALTFCGLATDYCVLFSVLDAIALGYHVTVVLDGCRAVEMTAGDGDRALHKMRQAGARLVTSHEL